MVRNALYKSSPFTNQLSGKWGQVVWCDFEPEGEMQKTGQSVKSGWLTLCTLCVCVAFIFGVILLFIYFIGPDDSAELP